ncbi:MAG: hypothetical protein ACI398_10520, partial [Clostridium sp.]
MKKQKIKSYIAAAMALSLMVTSSEMLSAKAESFKKIIEFEETNKFSNDGGNGVRSDLFSDYSGNGFV